MIFVIRGMTRAHIPLPFVFTLLLFFQLVLPQEILAQFPSCGTDHMHHEMLKNHPAFKRLQEKLNSDTYKKMIQKQKSKPGVEKNNLCGEENEEIYTIPVVVHIVHLPEDSIQGIGSNLSDATIQAGIDHLNDAFRNQGSYAGGPYHSNVVDFGIQSADVKIEFVLARRDPQGNSTTGINRISSDYSNLAYAEDGPNGFSSQDAYIKSLSFWDSRDYANVWLVNEICRFPDSLCGVAGYAYLAGAHGASYDGIVNEARYWGSSVHASKVHIHEFGHYLNLYHTFNDPDGGGQKTACENSNCLTDGDYVCDTPPDNSSSAISCNSSATSNSCTTDADDTSPNNPFTSDVNDLYENYMDYGYQSCQNTFTPGQKDRMRLALTGIRSSLLSSPGSKPVSQVDAEIAEIISPAPNIGCESFLPKVVLLNQGSTFLSSATIGVIIDGNHQPAFNWSGNLAQGATDTFDLNSISIQTGIHQIEVFLQAVNGQSADEYVFNDSSSTCFEVYTASNTFPYCENFENLSAPPDHWQESNAEGEDFWEIYSSLSDCDSVHGNSAYYLDNWNAFFPSTGIELDLYLNSMDLENVNSPKLYFSRSYKSSYTGRALELDISISNDCGSSFQSLQSYSDLELATVPGPELVNAWIPDDCSDWEEDSVDLSNYVGQNILIRFRASVEAYYAQNLFLDNICVKGEAAQTCSSLDLEISHVDESCLAGNGSATVLPGDGI
ncbi:MAG: M43 family zinc metalloprotease, partial [Bacteroidota bacterium]